MASGVGHFLTLLCSTIVFVEKVGKVPVHQILSVCQWEESLFAA